MPFDYTSFPAKYRPPMDDQGNRIAGVKAALVDATPLERLPYGLVPRLGFHLQPPIFHYARRGKHGFLVLEYPDTSDEAYEELDEFERTLPNYRETIEKLVPLLRERGVHTCQLQIRLVTYSPPVAISLTTNYLAGNRTPPAKRLRSFKSSSNSNHPLDGILTAQRDIGTLRG
ncbi:hypothetical protein BD779DRAFT_1476128 [Infundibulicybe gibba]|nr:hypothetical protein BD779DRAFT_1476128 [Infundibulicybe gibba]